MQAFNGVSRCVTPIRKMNYFLKLKSNTAEKTRWKVHKCWKYNKNLIKKLKCLCRKLVFFLPSHKLNLLLPVSKLLSTTSTHSASLLRKTSEQIRHSRIFQTLKLGGGEIEGIQIDIFDFLGSQLGRVVTAYCPVLVIGLSPRTLVKHWTIQSSCEILIHNIVIYWKIFTQVNDFDFSAFLLGVNLWLHRWQRELLR